MVLWRRIYLADKLDIGGRHGREVLYCNELGELNNLQYRRISLYTDKINGNAVKQVSRCGYAPRNSIGFVVVDLPARHRSRRDKYITPNVLLTLEIAD